MKEAIILLTRKDLRDKRGWTDKLTETFLPGPDQQYLNPKDKKTTIKLYQLSKISLIEESQEFKEAKRISDIKKIQSANASKIKKIKP